MIRYYSALYFSVFLGAGGQLLLKWGTAHHERLIHLFIDPFLMLGLGCYFVAALFYIYALKEIPLSVAFPSVALSYLLVAYAAHLLFGEPLSSIKWFAMALILSGVFLLTKA